MKCPKCNEEMRWHRKYFFQNKTHVCFNCGYSLKKKYLSKAIIENPMYSVLSFIEVPNSIILIFNEEEYKNFQKRLIAGEYTMSEIKILPNANDPTLNT